MKTTLSFEDGPTEPSESFVIFYLNEFGVPCFAYQNAERLLGFVAESIQESWMEDNEDWPDGRDAGAYFNAE